MKKSVTNRYLAAVKKLILPLLMGISGLLPQPASSQICDSLTPVFTVDLSSSPQATWISPAGKRDGLCCGAMSPDVCVEFIITLAPGANGIKFDIASGAVPPGALFYQINCGPIVKVGDPVCLSGVGPHLLTFCKPGNNTNQYQITSYPKPSLQGANYVSQACSGQMSVVGLMDTGITWTSVPFDAIHNGYLNCNRDCDTVIVTHPGGTAPPYVDYQVCGYILGGCNPVYFCDTLRVNFVNDLAVNITPHNPTICFGGTPATVTANPTGGLLPYSYVWSTGATTQSISVTAGTYWVRLTDAMGCSVATDTVVVSALPSPIAANAGPDQLMCTGIQSAVQLNGSFVASTGAQWINGNGFFSPNSATMNAIYTPTASEISAGYVDLLLVTTGNSGCPADTDQVHITIGAQPVPVIAGPSPVCAYRTATYSVTPEPNVNYNWTVAGGTITSVTASSISVRWNGGASGTVTVTATQNTGCDTTVSKSVTINPTPAPVITGTGTSCVYTTNTYSLQTTTSNTILWTVTGGQIIGQNNATSVNVQWNTAGTGTVTVTETTSLGCDSTVSRTVTVGQTSLPIFTGPTTLCAYDAATYTATFTPNTTYTWSVTGGTVIANAGTSVSVRWNAGPSGSVTLTATNASGCDSTMTQAVTLRPTPIPVITGPAGACQYQVMTYALQSTTSNAVNWSVTGGQISGSSTGNSVTVAWNTAGTGTVSVTETHPLGCDSTVSIPVTVRATSVPQINGPSTVCAFDASSYYTPLTANTTYTWNITGGTVTSNSGTAIVVRWNAGPTGTITLTATNASGCDSVVTRSVTIHPTPVPVITGVASACTQTTNTYALQSPTSNAVTWSVTGGTITGSTTSTSIQVFWTNPGTNLVTVTEVNSLGCDSTVTFPVSVGITSVPVINGPNTVCAYSRTSYYTPVWSNTTYTWNVSGGTIVSNTGPAITVVWNAVPTGSISLTASNISGCDSTVLSAITINPTPVPVILGATANCTQTTDVYNVASPSSNTYAWTVNGGTILGPSNQPTVSVYWTTPGIGRVTLTETNSLGCDSTVAVNVQINARPWPVLSGRPTVCELDTGTYAVPFVAGHNYIWNVVGGGIVGFSVSNSITVQWYTPGTGSVSCRQVSPSGCDSLVSMNVLINGKPSPYISGPASSCQSMEYTYSVTPTSGNQYNWSVTGGTILNGTTTAQANVRWNTTGVGNITLLESTPAGCATSANTSVQVNARPAPLITGSTVGCISPTRTSSYSVVNEPGIYYLWTVAGGTIMSGNGTNSVDITWNAPGNHMVTVAAIDLATGCDSVMNKAVLVDSLSPVSVAAPSYAGCSPLSISFSGNTPTPTTHYQWRFGDGGSSTSANPSHTFTVAGTYPVTLYASNNTGCADSAQAVITVFPTPLSSFTQQTSSPVYYAGSSTLTLNNQSVGAVQYDWDFGNGDHSQDFEPQYTYTVPGLYQIMLVATNAYGCRDTSNSILDVRVPEDLYVPNAFTPNGDAVNDYFSVAWRNITALNVYIYDRWGEQVYKSDHVDFAWDGTFHGQPVKQDVYVYLIKATGFHGKVYDLKGTVTVVR